MKNIILLVAAVLLLVVGGRLLRPSQTVAPETTAPTVPPAAEVTNDAEATVSSMVARYTDDGFEPVEVTVPVGTSVTWSNETENRMWVASDPHPQHTNLPELDAKQPAAAGESYTFTFTEVGTWNYHNHANPSHVGTIIVTE